MLNFYCLKWGTKYGPEYVTRLRNSLEIYVQKEFSFICITDDPVNGIQCEDLRKYKLYREPVFTAEKMELMMHKHAGTNILLDLDILIHGDITHLCMEEPKLPGPRFIYTHWTPKWHWKKLVPKKTACFINSSFVKWEGARASFIYSHYMKNRKKYQKEYNSFDKYVFYEHYLHGGRGTKFPTWGEEFCYNYNEQGGDQYLLRKDKQVCLFNTSHLVKMGRRYYELDNTPTEHTDIWESYDD